MHPVAENIEPNFKVVAAGDGRAVGALSAGGRQRDGQRPSLGRDAATAADAARRRARCPAQGRGWCPRARGRSTPGPRRPGGPELGVDAAPGAPRAHGVLGRCLADPFVTVSAGLAHQRLGRVVDEAQLLDETVDAVVARQADGQTPATRREDRPESGRQPPGCRPSGRPDRQGVVNSSNLGPSMAPSAATAGRTETRPGRSRPQPGSPLTPPGAWATRSGPHRASTCPRCPQPTPGRVGSLVRRDGFGGARCAIRNSGGRPPPRPAVSRSASCPSPRPLAPHRPVRAAAPPIRPPNSPIQREIASRGGAPPPKIDAQVRGLRRTDHGTDHRRLGRSRRRPVGGHVGRSGGASHARVLVGDADN